jgi:hypothetical protein
MHRLARTVLAAALAATILLAAPPAPVGAAGPDPCPEPNDEFQAGCRLADGGEAVGYLFHPKDVDAYRIEALDFNVGARLELAEMPHPYQFILADWNGAQLAASAPEGGREVIDATLGPPGTYYVFVGTQFGDASDERPYRLTARLTYPAGSAPHLVYSREFREGASFVGSTERGDYAEEGGKKVITMKVPRHAPGAAGGLERLGDGPERLHPGGRRPRDPRRLGRLHHQVPPSRRPELLSPDGQRPRRPGVTE